MGDNERLIEVDEVETKEEKSESQKIIRWTGDTAEYDKVLKEYNMDKLKRMLLGGAPYLYEKDPYPMHQVAYYSRADIMKIILEKHKNEGNPENTLFSRQTANALNAICQNNCGDIARLLLRANTPIIPSVHLHTAALNGSTAVLDEILTKNPNIEFNTIDSQKNTPLHKAVEGKQPHTVQYLLNHNADPNIANEIGYNSVHMACQYADIDILYLLTTRGGDVNAKDHKGKTPVMIAAKNGKDGCIHILAAAGASLDQRDKKGNAPLIVAASQGYTKTVRELIRNGASFVGINNEGYDALERAIMKKRDKSAAMIIRLRPEVDFFKQYYLQTCKISSFQIIRYRLTETLKALLDRMVVQNDPLDCTHGIVRTEYLYAKTDNPENTPKIRKAPEAPETSESKNEDQKSITYFLQLIAGLNNEEIAYHGTIRLLVDEKMKKFGRSFLSIKIFFNVLFLLSLAYSSILAAYEPIQLNVYTKDSLNIIRIFTELYVMSYFILNVVTEGVEFYKVAMLSDKYLEDKKMDNEKKKDRDARIENGNQTDNDDEDNKSQKKKPAKRSIFSRLNDNTFVRVFTDYLSGKFNYLDVLGLLTLFILIILRVTTQPTQWIFTTLTFLINCIRSFKLIALIPGIGPYTNVIYKILVKDVPLFSTHFVLTLLIFTGGYFVSLRTPYTIPGFVNASLNQRTENISGVDNEVQWVFLSGLRVLLKENIYEGQYLFRHLNWLAASLYLGFLFLTTVVYLNVFIAQLSNTYRTVRENAERTYAWHRLNFIVQLETTSLMSLGLDYRKDYFIKEIPIDEETLFKYYGVRNIRELNVNSFRKDVDTNTVLATLQCQQKVMRREIVNINKAEESQTQGIRELKDGMAKLVRMFEEKFNELK